MEGQPKIVSREETIHRVMELHEKGFGCRKISATLKSEGIATSKDTVWRIIREHKVKMTEQRLNRTEGLDN